MVMGYEGSHWDVRDRVRNGAEKPVKLCAGLVDVYGSEVLDVAASLDRAALVIGERDANDIFLSGHESSEKRKGFESLSAEDVSNVSRWIWLSRKKVKINYFICC
tara:strand:- start:1045 stop:1359 length:315 start_codon:yes stop_codon:yes gene_type:complete